MEDSKKGFGMIVEKSKVLVVVFVQIEKQFGKGLIMWMGDGEVVEDIQVVFMGLLGFDIVLGVGGLLCGWVVEIYGLELFGKIMFMLQVIVELQKLGGIVVFIDVEYVFDV